jgi:hypothetical protein
MKQDIYCQYCHNLLDIIEHEKYEVDYTTCDECQNIENKPVIGLADVVKIVRSIGAQKILIFAVKDDLNTVTTFGESKEDSIEMANLGNWFKRNLGFPEQCCNEKSLRDK